MLNRIQIWMQITGRALVALAVVALALCVVPTRASAAIQSKKRTTHHRVRHVRYRRYWRHRIVLPRAPSADRTEQIQAALVRAGDYTGDPNGKWDTKTREAVQQYQESNGLPATGKLDAITLQRLGLGSDIAGLSAPKVVPPPAQNSDSATFLPKGPGGK